MERSSSQLYVGWMGLGWDWVGMVIIARRKSKSTFGANKFVLLESYLAASTVQE